MAGYFGSTNFGAGSFSKSFKNPYSFSAGRVGDTSTALFNALQSRKKAEDEFDEDRSLLDRTFDTLLIPNYVVAGAFDGAIRDDRTILGGAWDGLKAGNPFSDGYQQGETTFTNVIESAGWKPESLGGKAVKGTLGFILDVALDPTTYLTGGMSAAVRGTGRMGSAKTALSELGKLLPETMTKGKEITHMTSEMAEHIIKQTGSVEDASQLARDSKALADRYNKLIGIRDADGGKPITFGIENMPFGEKIAPKLGAFGKTITLSDGKGVRDFADKIGTAHSYSKLRDAIYGSRLGKLSTNSELKKLAEKNPSALYEFIQYVDITKGAKISKIEKDKLIREKAKRLMNLSPADSKEVIKHLEDNQTFVKMVDTLRLSETQKGKDIVKLAKQIHDSNLEVASELDGAKGALDELGKLKNLTDEEQSAVDAIKKQFSKKVIDKDVKHHESMKERMARIRELEVKKAEMESAPKVEKVVVKSEAPEVPEETVNLKQLYDDSISEAEAFGNEREMGKILRGIQTKVGKRTVSLSDEHLMKGGTQVTSKYKLRDALNKLIYNGDGKLSDDFRMSNIKQIIDLQEIADDPKKLKEALESGTSFFGKLMPAQVNDLLDRIHYGELGEALREYIESKPYLFSQHADDVRKYVARQLGFESYEKDIKNPFNELSAKKNLTADEAKQLIEYKRTMKARNEMFKKYFNETSYEEFSEILKREKNTGSYDAFHEMILEPEETARRNRFTQEDQALVDTFEAKDGKKYEYKNLKSGEFDEHNPMPDNMRFQKDEMESLYDELFSDYVKSKFRTTDSKTGARISNVSREKIRAYKPNEFDNRFLSTRLNTFKEAINKMYPNSKYSQLDTQQRNILKKVSNAMAWARMKGGNADEILKEQHKANVVQEVKKVIAQKKVERHQTIVDNLDIGHVVTFKNGNQTLDGEVIGRIPNTVETKRVESQTTLERVEYTDKKGNKKFRNEPKHTLKEIKQFEKDGTFSYNVRMSDGSEVTVDPSDVQKYRIKEDAPIEEVMKATPVIETTVERMKDMSEEIASITKEIKREKRNMASAKSHYKKSRQTILDEMNDMASKHTQKIKTLEEQAREFRDIVKTVQDKLDAPDIDVRIEQLAKEQEDLLSALDSEEALADFVSNYLGEDVQKILHDANVRDSMKTVLSENASSKEVEDVVKWVRQELLESGVKEVEIGKLPEEAFTKLFETYVPRILTEEGERFFRNASELKPLEARYSVTQDLGYGVKFNPHAKSRSIKGSGIEEINKYFRDNKQVAKLFEDNIAKIYEARMMKHNELVYDDEYMKVMLEKFGHEIVDGEPLMKGYSPVANYGMIKRTVEDTTSMRLSLQISNDVTDFLKVYFQENRGTRMNDSQMSELIEGFLKETYPDGKMKEVYEGLYNQTISDMGLGEKTFGAHATPMVQVEEKSIKAMKEIYEGTRSSMVELIDRQMVKSAIRKADKLDNPEISRIAKEIQAIEDKYKDIPEGQFREMRQALVERLRFEIKQGGTKDQHLNDLMKRFDNTLNTTPPQVRQVSDVIVEKANQTRMLAMLKDESRALQMYDKFLHFMKLQQTVIMPSFHIRNKFSNVFQNWLGVGRDSMNLRFQKDAINASRWMDDPEKLKTMKPVVSDDGTRVYHWDEIIDLAKKHGGIDDGYFAQDLSTDTMSSGLFKDKIKPKWNPTDTGNFMPYRVGTKIGTTVENSDRLLHIASLLRQGKTIDDAVDSSKKFLFDYSELTTFEKNVMKRIFPYYTWMRKNSRLQVESLIDQPGKYQLTAKAMNGIEGMNNEEDRVNDAYVSDFAKDWIQTPFSFEKKDKDGNPTGEREPILLSPNLPFMDIARIPDPTRPIDSLKGLFSQTAPQIKVPVELATNHNFFFDSEIAGEENPVSGRLGHIASQFAPVNAIKGGVDKSAGDTALNALSVLGGVKMTAYDYEASKRRALQEYYEKLQAQQ